MWCLRLGCKSVEDNAVLEEEVVRCEWSCPSRSCRSEEWHWDAEPDFGRHCDDVVGVSGDREAKRVHGNSGINRRFADCVAVR